MAEVRHPMAKYLRPGAEATTACPGCGDGIIAHSVLRAIDRSGMDMDNFVFVCGIGCAGWIPSPYFDADTLHTTHGRPIAFATGVKLAMPDREVMVISGDGDLFAIGGNHMLHAARRNVGINVICVNNFNYGMTGGQGGPTTPMGARTSTTPYGCFEAPLNIPWLVAALGAEFVARWTALHVRQLKDAMARMMEKKGFTLIEVLAPCPIGFGRPNDLGEGLDEMHLYQEECIVDDNADLEKAGIDLRQKEPIVLGNFVDTERTPFTTVPEQFR